MEINFRCNISKEEVLNHYNKVHPDTPIEQKVLIKWIEKPYDFGICDGVCFRCIHCSQSKDYEE